MSSTSSEHDRAFISAQSFSGVKSGYFYGTGNKGVGYYEDLINNNKKRDRFENPSVDPPASKIRFIFECKKYCLQSITYCLIITLFACLSL